MKVSDEFYHAFCHSGSLVISCQYCGRTFFGDYGGYEGELEQLEAKAKATPDKYKRFEGVNGAF